MLWKEKDGGQVWVGRSVSGQARGRVEWKMEVGSVSSEESTLDVSGGAQESFGVWSRRVTGEGPCAGEAAAQVGRRAEERLSGRRRGQNPTFG